MALQLLQFKITKGMNQDADMLTATPDTAFRLFNLKTLSLDNNTNNALTNEKGNSPIKLINVLTREEDSINGTILGVILCTPEMVVVFTYLNNTTNIIYKIVYNKEKDCLIKRVVALGDFNIPRTATVSGIFVYEHSELLKIYWIDGVNLLRYLNIADSNEVFNNGGYILNVQKLNSCPTFKMDHHIKVEKVAGGGVFTAGVIQYAFTYFNKYGAETNLIDMTPLYYISEDDRGITNDETVGCSFKVTVENPDTSFDFIRLYSILRTSLNSVPIVKIVGDIKLNKNG